MSRYEQSCDEQNASQTTKDEEGDATMEVTRADVMQV